MRRLFLVLASLFLLASCNQTDVPTVSKEIESPVFGAPNSQVQMIIFTDFQCPACIYFEKTIGEELFKNYVETNKITLTYKNYPLPFHKNARRDALAVMCSLAQGKYKEYGKEMYVLEEAKAGKNVSDEERLDIAKKVSGLDQTAFATCLSEGHYLNSIGKDMAYGDSLNLQGTPAVYINGKLVQFQSKEEFFKILDASLAQ